MNEHDSDMFTKASVRLDFTPSEVLGNALNRFYRSDYQLEDDDSYLKSVDKFNISYYGPNKLIRPDPYHIENHGEPTVAARMTDLQNKHLPQIADQELPMSSNVLFANTRHGSLVLRFLLLPDISQRDKLRHFSELVNQPSDRTNRTLYVDKFILLSKKIITSSELEKAKSSLRQLMAARAIAGSRSEYATEHAPTDNSRLYLKVCSKLAVRELPQLVNKIV